MNPQWPYPQYPVPPPFSPQPLQQTPWNIQDANPAPPTVNANVLPSSPAFTPVSFPFHVPPPNIISTNIPPPTFCTNFVPPNYPVPASHSSQLTEPSSSLVKSPPPLPSESPPPLPSEPPPPLPSASPPSLPIDSPCHLPSDSSVFPIQAESVSLVSSGLVLDNSSPIVSEFSYVSTLSPVLSESSTSSVDSKALFSNGLSNDSLQSAAIDVLSAKSTVSLPVESTEFLLPVVTKSLTLTLVESSTLPVQSLSTKSSGLLSEKNDFVPVESSAAPVVSATCSSADLSPVLIQSTLSSGSPVHTPSNSLIVSEAVSSLSSVALDNTLSYAQIKKLPPVLTNSSHVESAGFSSVPTVSLTTESSLSIESMSSRVLHTCDKSSVSVGSSVSPTVSATCVPTDSSLHLIQSTFSSALNSSAPATSSLCMVSESVSSVATDSSSSTSIKLLLSKSSVSSSVESTQFSFTVSEKSLKPVQIESISTMPSKICEQIKHSVVTESSDVPVIATACISINSSPGLNHTKLFSVLDGSASAVTYPSMVSESSTSVSSVAQNSILFSGSTEILSPKSIIPSPTKSAKVSFTELTESIPAFTESLKNLSTTLSSSLVELSVAPVSATCVSTDSSTFLHQPELTSGLNSSGSVVSSPSVVSNSLISSPITEKLPSVSTISSLVELAQFSPAVSSESLTPMLIKSSLSNKSPPDMAANPQQDKCSLTIESSIAPVVSSTNVSAGSSPIFIHSTLSSIFKSSGSTTSSLIPTSVSPEQKQVPSICYMLVPVKFSPQPVSPVQNNLRSIHIKPNQTFTFQTPKGETSGFNSPHVTSPVSNTHIKPVQSNLNSINTKPNHTFTFQSSKGETSSCDSLHVTSPISNIHIESNHTHMVQTSKEETPTFNFSHVTSPDSKQGITVIGKKPEQFVSSPPSSSMLIKNEESAFIHFAEAMVSQPLLPVNTATSSKESLQDVCPSEDHDMKFLQRQVMQDHNYCSFADVIENSYLWTKDNFELNSQQPLTTTSHQFLATVIAKDHDYCLSLNEPNDQSVLKKEISKKSNRRVVSKKYIPIEDKTQQSNLSKTPSQIQLGSSFVKELSHNILPTNHTDNDDSNSKICNSDFKKDENNLCHKIIESKENVDSGLEIKHKENVDSGLEIKHEKNIDDFNQENKHMKSQSETFLSNKSSNDIFGNNKSLSKNVCFTHQQSHDDFYKKPFDSNFPEDKIDRFDSMAKLNKTTDSDSKLENAEENNLSKLSSFNMCNTSKFDLCNQQIQKLFSSNQESLNNKIVEHLGNAEKFDDKVEYTDAKSLTKVSDSHENVYFKSENFIEENSYTKNNSNEHIQKLSSINQENLNNKVIKPLNNAGKSDDKVKDIDAKSLTKLSDSHENIYFESKIFIEENSCTSNSVNEHIQKLSSTNQENLNNKTIENLNNAEKSDDKVEDTDAKPVIKMTDSHANIYFESQISIEENSCISNSVNKHIQNLSSTNQENLNDKTIENLNNAEKSDDKVEDTDAKPVIKMTDSHVNIYFESQISIEENSCISNSVNKHIQNFSSTNQENLNNKTIENLNNGKKSDDKVENTDANSITKISDSHENIYIKSEIFIEEHSCTDNSSNEHIQKLSSTNQENLNNKIIEHLNYAELSDDKVEGTDAKSLTNVSHKNIYFKSDVFIEKDSCTNNSSFEYSPKEGICTLDASDVTISDPLKNRDTSDSSKDTVPKADSHTDHRINVSSANSETLKNSDTGNNQNSSIQNYETGKTKTVNDIELDMKFDDFKAVILNSNENLNSKDSSNKESNENLISCIKCNYNDSQHEINIADYGNKESSANGLSVIKNVYEDSQHEIKNIDFSNKEAAENGLSVIKNVYDDSHHEIKKIDYINKELSENALSFIKNDYEDSQQETEDSDNNNKESNENVIKNDNLQLEIKTSDFEQQKFVHDDEIEKSVEDTFVIFENDDSNETSEACHNQNKSDLSMSNETVGFLKLDCYDSKLRDSHREIYNVWERSNLIESLSNSTENLTRRQYSHFGDDKRKKERKHRKRKHTQSAEKHEIRDHSHLIETLRKKEHSHSTVKEIGSSHISHRRREHSHLSRSLKKSEHHHSVKSPRKSKRSSPHLHKSPRKHISGTKEHSSHLKKIMDERDDRSLQSTKHYHSNRSPESIKNYNIYHIGSPESIRNYDICHIGSPESIKNFDSHHIRTPESIKNYNSYRTISPESNRQHSRSPESLKSNFMYKSRSPKSVKRLRDHHRQKSSEQLEGNIKDYKFVDSNKEKFESVRINDSCKESHDVEFKRKKGRHKSRRKKNTLTDLPLEITKAVERSVNSEKELSNTHIDSDKEVLQDVSTDNMLRSKERLRSISRDNICRSKERLQNISKDSISKSNEKLQSVNKDGMSGDKKKLKRANRENISRNRERLQSVSRDDISRKERLQSVSREDISRKERLHSVSRDDISRKERLHSVSRDDISRKERLHSVSRDDISRKERLHSVSRDEISRKSVSKDDISRKESLQHISRHDKASKERSQSVSSDRIARKGRLHSVHRDDISRKERLQSVSRDDISRKERLQSVSRDDVSRSKERLQSVSRDNVSRSKERLQSVSRDDVSRSKERLQSVDRSDRSRSNGRLQSVNRDNIPRNKKRLHSISREDLSRNKDRYADNQKIRRRRRSSTPKDLPCLSLKTYKYVCSTPADDYYYSKEKDSKEVIAKDALKALHEKFKYELVERAERVRASKPRYDPPKRKTKLRKPKPPKTDSNSDSSSSSEKSSSEEEDTSMEELERKKKHPYRLHLELWFNDPKEMNDGPLCRCSAKARRAGIRHGIYVGEDHLPLCNPLSNNADRLYHYRITMTPHTNFLTKNPTTIYHNGQSYRFEGFSMFSHSKLPPLPNCKVIRFNYEYTIVYAEEEFPRNFTVEGLELFSRYLLVEILELVDLNWKAHDDPDGCPRFHFMPRFTRELRDGGKELLSHCYVLDYLLKQNQILVDEKKLSKILALNNLDWQDLADEVKGMIITCPGMKPSSIRVDQLDREQCLPDKEEFPVIVHFGVRPPQLSYAGNPHYQKAWRDYVKYRHLLANKPKVRYADRHRLLQKEVRLQEMRMENDLKRDVTVVISSKDFYKTGIMSDVVQHAMLLPVLVCHLRFHQSLTHLENKLGYKFKDRFLLQLALTHPSYRENFGTNPDHARNSLTNCGLRQPQYGDRRIHYMNTRKRGINTLINIMSRFGSRTETLSRINHNERLEFLGDAVVEFLSSIHLFYMFPDLEEGGLATYRAAIVQNQHLAVLSKKLELDRFMLYAHGSDLCHDLELRHAMANCFEALMGALFLDNGIEIADKVFSKTLFLEVELLEVWMNFSPHPLQEQEPHGDRQWIESVPLLQKLHKFEETIGIEFNHIRLLARALTHRSLGYNNLTLGSNQRLEFLGDTVLQLVASEYLYKFFPEHHEGHLSLLRSSLVNNRTQAVVCADLGMVDYAIYPYDKVELKPKDKADLLEAFLGALYVDKDLGYCRKFCEVCFFPRLQDFIMNQDWNDPKSKLQQCCLTLRSMDGGEPDIPTYKVIECKGPTNTRVYSVAVYFQGNRLAVGSGHSIQQAEMDAASNALNMSKDLFPQLRHQRRAIERSLKKRPLNKNKFSLKKDKEKILDKSKHLPKKDKEKTPSKSKHSPKKDKDKLFGKLRHSMPKKYKERLFSIKYSPKKDKDKTSDKSKHSQKKHKENIFDKSKNLPKKYKVRTSDKSKHLSAENEKTSNKHKNSSTKEEEKNFDKQKHLAIEDEENTSDKSKHLPTKEEKLSDKSKHLPAKEVEKKFDPSKHLPTKKVEKTSDRSKHLSIKVKKTADRNKHLPIKEIEKNSDKSKDSPMIETEKTSDKSKDSPMIEAEKTSDKSKHSPIEDEEKICDKSKHLLKTDEEKIS